MDDITYSLLTFEKHTPESILLNNHICFSKGYKQRIQINNHIGYLEFLSPQISRDKRPLQSIPFVIKGHTGCIVLPELCFRNRLKRFLPKNNFTDLPPELHIAVIEAALDYELSLFEKILGIPIEVASINQQQGFKADDITVSFSLTWEGHHPIEGYLSFKQPLLPLLLKAFEKIPKRKTHNWNLLSKKIHFEIGSTQLSAAMLRDVVVGDVIFLDQCPFIFKDTVSISIARDFLLEGQVKENLIVINERCQDIKMDEKKSELIDMDNLPINLVFEVGEQDVSLGELKTLQPGYAFTLNTPLEKPVTIRANGHRIGSGELLNINNRIGVRVLELSGQFDG
jgi:type III secretion protein Q